MIKTRLMKGSDYMTREQIEDMAQQLLNISFDIYEYKAIKEVADQIEVLKRIKETKSVFDTRIDLFDLLEEAYKTNYFESEL